MAETWKLLVLSFMALTTACNGNLPPSFLLDMNNLVLSEKTPVGEVVFTLEGMDPENSPVHFGLIGTDRLNVDRNTGKVTVVKPLDREINDTLNFIVTIEDEVENAPNGRNNVVQVPVNIIISDENDNKPIFENLPYDIVTKEDTPIGTTIFSNIKVTDPDSVGDNIEVECINLPENEHACDVFIVEGLNSAQNNYNGIIKLKEILNYAKTQEYKFLLQATDGQHNSTTIVNINVGDVQDTPPKFTSNLTSTIHEDVPINTLVMKIHAEDGDKGAPRKIVYELVNNPMNYFLLDAITGELRTARPLDKESIDNLEGILKLNIKAIEIIDGLKGNDALTVTNAVATVIIKDINDEPPMFNHREYSVEIPENIPEGSILPNLDMIVTDPDIGNNSVFGLSLNDISNAFIIEPAIVNGSTFATIRIVNSSLDYENPNQRKFIILAIAKELYTESLLSSTATVTITVVDANDNAPIFEQEGYSAIISEMASPKTLVTTVSAKDRDSGKFGENGIVYQLLGNGAEKFHINNRTGVITVGDCEYLGTQNCLDYETNSQYLLSVKATDDDGKGQTTMVPLKIILTDINDNPPIFNQPLYRVFVDENAVKFEPDLFVMAIDIDKTSHVTYSIISGNNDNLFNIDSNSGKLRISNQGLNLSKDKHGSNNVVLTVKATDGKYTTTTLVDITIKDVNNNEPKFDQSNYVESIPEDLVIGTSIVKLHATDEDSGVNANIHYKIQKGGYDDFIIDSLSGIIKVTSKLDYDRRNTYNIEVIAADKGEPSLTGTTTLTINIINTNDKLPYFVPTTQKAEVMEDAEIGTIVHTLIALDPDVNSSEALNFAATEPITAVDKHGVPVLENEIFKEFFSVNKNTGKVSVINPLQRDIAAEIRITVLVTDITAPTVQQGQGLFVITISDVNDSPPKFLPPWTKDNPIYKLQLKEEQPVGTIIATYTAIDEDSDISGYIIYPKSDYFEINNGTGIVQIKKQIDYEKTNHLNFTIIAFDSGIPQLNASAHVFVDILNINDNDPVFPQKEYNASIKENSEVGTVVITISASDKDAGDYGMIKYSLIGEHSDNFKIDPISGVITVANSAFLDHEILNETILQVVATDSAPNNLKRSISIPICLSISDVNDNAPKFSSSTYNVTIIENIRLNPPIPIIQVNATDLDDGINGNIHYSIISGNDNEVFLLGVETGILYPHKSLIGKTRAFNLLIEARDGGGNGNLYDRATIHIQVLNVNEHKPKFIMPALSNATVEITENDATEDYLVMTVKASDKDDGENGRVSYHLKVNGENVQETNEFIINTETGELKTKVFLDREEKAKYELILVAKDHGSPKWYESVSYLTVLLVDTNDNRPEFPDTKTSNPYNFYITENDKSGIMIGQVKALDRDEGKHAKVYYYILYGNQEYGFYLDKSSGSLYTNKSFDREYKNEYNLYIIANNDPDFYVSPEIHNQMTQDEILHDSSIAKVKITINDINDNAPVFEQFDYYSAVDAMAKINDFVVNISASDPDFAINGSITYYVKSSNLFKYGSNKSSGSIIPSPFNITQQGQLTTATYLSENNQHRFVVDVIAKENAYPEREAMTKVHVWIFEQEQLIRVILSRPTEEVLQEKEEIIAELSNATQSRVIINDIRYHIGDNNYKNEEWTDMYILVVDPSTHTILPVPDVLKIIDGKYDFLKDYYAGFAIENVIPAFPVESNEIFDPALAALIALLIVLFVGIITFIVVCCCLRHWVISPTDLKKKDALIKKAIIDDLNTTENPLWIEQKLKIYEEQELTMQVFNEPEQNALTRRGSDELMPDDNTYATIQHPNRRGSSHMATLSLADDLADYATLSGVPHNSNSSHSSLRGVPNYYEAALGFQGSTFQVPEPVDNNTNIYDGYRSCFKGSELTINHDGQPEYVAELI